MTIKRKRFTKGIELKPDDLTTEPLERQGELALDSSDDKLKYRNATATKEVVNTDEAQTIENKSIVNPTRSDIKKDTESNLTTYASTASNGQLCYSTDTKKAFKIVDGALVELGSGTGGGTAETTTYSGTLNSDNVKGALDEVDADLGSHVASATAHKASDIVNIPSGNLSATDQQAVNNELQQSIDAISGGGGSSPITVVDETTTLTTDVSKFTFVGGGVVVTEPVPDEVLVTIPTGSGGTAIGTSYDPSANPETSSTNLQDAVTDMGVAITNASSGAVIEQSATTFHTQTAGDLSGSSPANNVINNLTKVVTTNNTSNPVIISMNAFLKADALVTANTYVQLFAKLEISRNGTVIQVAIVELGHDSGTAGLSSISAPIGPIIDTSPIVGGSNTYSFKLVGPHKVTLSTGSNAVITAHFRQDG
jgi:hypothetical protein